MEKLNEARVYVGTYRKYNNGSIDGAWLTLSDYSDEDEFYEACKELHKDESDPEFMFQDWENIPSDLIGESWISANVFPLIEALSDMDETEQEAFFVWCDYENRDLENRDAYDLVRYFQDEYQGAWDSEEDFEYNIYEECYESGLSEFARTYFDHEAFARDLFMSDYWYQDGFVFLR